MGAGHDHSHHHHPHGDGPIAGRAFAWATALNVAFVGVEAALGFWAGSIALLADAAHNLTDVLGLLLAWGAAGLARRQPTAHRTYGLGKTTILAALLNAVLLIGTVGAVAWEAVGRLDDPPPVHALTVIAAAAAGVVINGVAAALFSRGRNDVNVRAAYLHLVADAAVSAGVVVAGIVMLATDWRWVDPVASLLVSVVILRTGWQLLREAFDLSTDAVPRGIDLAAVRSFLEQQPFVCDVHDVHIWAMSSTENAMTAHVVLEPDADQAAWLAAVHREMRDRFDICHCTVQTEGPEDAPCMRDHPADAPSRG